MHSRPPVLEETFYTTKSQLTIVSSSYHIWEEGPMASERCAVASALCSYLRMASERERSSDTLYIRSCSLHALFIPLLFSGHANSNLVKEEKSAYRERPTLLNHFGSFMIVLSRYLSLALLHSGVQKSETTRINTDILHSICINTF